MQVKRVWSDEETRDFEKSTLLPLLPVLVILFLLLVNLLVIPVSPRRVSSVIKYSHTHFLLLLNLLDCVNRWCQEFLPLATNLAHLKRVWSKKYSLVLPINTGFSRNEGEEMIQVILAEDTLEERRRVFSILSTHSTLPLLKPEDCKNAVASKHAPKNKLQFDLWRIYWPLHLRLSTAYPSPSLPTLSKKIIERQNWERRNWIEFSVGRNNYWAKLIRLLG